MGGRAIRARRTDRPSGSLLVALHDLRWSQGRFVRIEADRSARLTLVEQVVGLVEFDLDLVQPGDLGRIQATAGPGALPEASSSAESSLMWSKIVGSFTLAS